MKLYSWNVNGFRAIIQKPEWLEWFANSGADIIGLQETKAEPEQVPEAHRSPAGLHAYWSASAGKRGYSGVAVFAKNMPLAVSDELPSMHGEGRLLHLEYPAFHFCNIYFPNGQMNEERLAYKLRFYDVFLDFAQNLRRHKPVVVCGDFNTAHTPIDLARPKANEETSGFLPIERAWLDKFVAAGYVDTFRHINGDIKDAYSWWSFRQRAREKNVGWRIDYFFVSEELRGAVKNAWIEPHIHGSDHCPIGLDLDV